MIAEATGQEVRLLTPKGHIAVFGIRPETTDYNTVAACSMHDEYDLKSLPELTGFAIDVGAHVGGVTICLLLDNPDLHVIAVEALEENVAALFGNLERNGVADRCTVIHAAASSGSDPVRIKYGDGAGGDFGHQHRFIGGGDWNDDNSPAQVLEPVSLTTIVATATEFGDWYLTDRGCDFLKIDCEGCEWSFLDDPAVRWVDEIRGEMHPRPGGNEARLRELLDATHDVTINAVNDFGSFRAARR